MKYLTYYNHSNIMLILPTHTQSIEKPASVPEWKAATPGGSARQVRQLAGAKRPSWLTAGPPERVRLERRETVACHLPVFQTELNKLTRTITMFYHHNVRLYWHSIQYKNQKNQNIAVKPMIFLSNNGRISDK